MRRIPLCVLGVALVGLVGCGPRVLQEKSMDLEPGEIKTLTLLDLKKDWKVRVEVSSPGTPVNVYLVLEKDDKAAQDALMTAKPPANALAGEAATEGKTLEVTMPEQTGLAILVQNPLANKQKASVQIKASRP